VSNVDLSRPIEIHLRSFADLNRLMISATRNENAKRLLGLKEISYHDRLVILDNADFVS